MQIKICGVNTEEAIEAAIQQQVEFLGLVFYSPSPRYIDAKKAAALTNKYKGQINFVALFVNPDDEKLERIIPPASFDYIQLHGCETPERVQEIKEKYGLPIIKAMPIESKKSLQKIPLYFKDVDWFLFDAKPGPNIDKMPGGLGRVFDWTILEGYECPKPWMLAGGLGCENIEEALSILKPTAVDVSSNLEDAPGIKSPAKIKEFVKIVRNSQVEDSYI